MPESTLVLLAAVLSGAAAWAAGRRVGLSGQALRVALARTLECVGLAAGFFAVNLLAAVALTLALRAASGRFISLYVAADFTLPALSLVQAVALRWWWEASGR